MWTNSWRHQSNSIKIKKKQSNITCVKKHNRYNWMHIPDSGSSESGLFTLYCSSTSISDLMLYTFYQRQSYYFGDLEHCKENLYKLIRIHTLFFMLKGEGARTTCEASEEKCQNVFQIVFVFKLNISTSIRLAQQAIWMKKQQ